MAESKRPPSLFHNYLEALTNIFLFIPYFFSAPILFKTLFSPWKDIRSKKTIRYFSFADVFNRMMFDIVSRSIGLIMRSSILIFYLIVQTAYIIIFPILLITFCILYPLISLYYGVKGTDDDIKKRLKTRFIEKHLQNKDNQSAVEAWFEYIYATQIKDKEWWRLQRLTSMPPLARDWAVGYTPLVDDYCEDMTSTRYQMSIRSHLIGREKESRLLENVLSQSDEANAILVGEDGVGKHTILDALAKKMYEGKTNSFLAYKRLMSLNMEKVLGKYTDRQKQEEFFEQLLSEASESRHLVMVIENIDKYVTDSDNRVDLSTSIAKFAKTQHIQIIGITNPFLYEKYFFPNDNIKNIFSKVEVNEISRDTAYTILLQEVLVCEDKYGLTIPYETVIAILDKGSYYITSIPYPEKILQLLDWVCTAARDQSQKIISPQMVDGVITNRTQSPTTLTEKIRNNLLSLENILSNKILGQQEAVYAISSTLRRSFLLLGKRKKPIASFLFLGPTGVGKTETAKAITQVFFGEASKMIRFDMSLYQSKDDIPKLVGSIENLNPGLLTNAIRQTPYGVLLIDEIEKAHRDLLNIFLTLLDEGYFIDGFGQRVDCKNLMIVATSNAAASEIYQLLVKQKLYAEGVNGTEELINYLIEKNYFTPEFLNRFDGIVAYKPLENETAMSIAQNIVTSVQKEIFELHHITVKVNPQTLDELIKKGYNSAFGVRNLERIVRQHIEDKVAVSLLSESVKAGETLTL
jgi:ATP-dependent Clp protease ATP-binding subunit ClpA